METKKSHLTFVPGISGSIAFMCGMALAASGSAFYWSALCFLVFGFCFAVSGSQERVGHPCPFEYLEAHKKLTVDYFSLEKQEMVLVDEKGNSLFCKFPSGFDKDEKNLKIGSVLVTMPGIPVIFN